MGVITFNGRSSDEFGCVVSVRPDHTRGTRLGEVVEIPGRNTALTLEYGSYGTYTQMYQVSFKEGSDVPPHKRAAQVAEWLLGSSGFCRLEDSFEPDCYRLARFAGPLNIAQIAGEYGSCTLEFVCQPQRYLKSGESHYNINTPFDGPYQGTTIHIPGQIEISPIPHGAVSVYSSASEDNVFVAMFVDESGSGIGRIDTAAGEPVEVPSNAVGIYCVWNNPPDGFSAVVGMIDKSGEDIAICGVVKNNPVIFNPTSFDAMSLLKFTDVSEEPTPVPRYFTKEYRKGIGNGGAVVPASRENYITTTVSLDTFAYAIVSGLGYSFLDSNDNCVAYYSVGVSGQSILNEKKIIIPANATKIMLAGSDTVEASLSLLEKRTNPGVSAATINGTTISLDFSVHDTIYLDCDLHDAYYSDGSSANDKVIFTSVIDPYPTFPKFASGENTVIVGGSGFLDFAITPRWWTL